MNVTQLLDAAYKKIKGKQAPTSQEYADGLVTLNNMISSWSAEGLAVPYNTTEDLALVAGQSVYTIGSGGNFNTTRPLRVINAFIRDANSDDYPVDVTMTEAEYNALSVKDDDGRPERLYYDPQYALGKIYFDKEPSTVETLYLVSEKALTEFALLTTTVNLPDFYKEALVYNLAVRLADDFDFQLMPTVFQTAAMSKNTIENINAKDKLIKTVDMDVSMTYSLYRG